MPSIVIDKNSLKGGLKSDLTGLANSQEARSDQYVRSLAIDLFRLGLEGHITPAQTFNSSGVSNAGITSLPRSVAVDITAATPNILYILGGLAGTAPKTVVTQSPDTYVSSAAISAHGGHNFTTLPSTGFWGEDIILYKVASTFYCFYSWNDSVDGDVGRMTVAGGSADDDFMSTTPASAGALTAAVPHRMAEGADGKLYITNGRYVSQFDGATGANGTLNLTAYDLGVGWIATDIRSVGNYLAVASVKAGASFIAYSYSSECRVTLWNMTEPGLGLVYYIDDNYVSALYPTSAGLYAFTQGKTNTAKVWKFNGQGFTKVWENGIYNSAPDPRSIETYKGLLVWAIANSGVIFALDLETDGVHMPFYPHDGTNISASSGLLKNTDQSYLLLGGNFNGTYKTVSLTLASTGYVTSSVVNADLRTRVFRIPYKSIINKITVFFSQMESGSSATFSLFRNYVNSSVGTAGTDLLAGATPSQTVSYASNGSLTEYEIPCSIHSTSAFYMNIRVSGQISIAAIVVDYDLLK